MGINLYLLPLGIALSASFAPQKTGEAEEKEPFISPLHLWKSCYWLHGATREESHQQDETRAALNSHSQDNTNSITVSCIFKIFDILPIKWKERTLKIWSISQFMDSNLVSKHDKGKATIWKVRL